MGSLRKCSSLDELSSSQELHQSSIARGMQEETKDGHDHQKQHHAPKSNQEMGVIRDENVVVEMLETQQEIMLDQLDYADKAGSPSDVKGDDAASEEALPKITTDTVKHRQRKIRVGVCCMQKKLQSRPMREILNFLSRNEEIDIVRFNNQMLLDLPIEEWHMCDVLIAFYSTGFPLAKAITYVNKFKPVMINDLEVQHELWDRVTVLEKLKKINVPVAKSIVVYRGPRTPFTQEEIEAQSMSTKDKGEFYLKKAQENDIDGMPLHRRTSSKNSGDLTQKALKQSSEEKQMVGTSPADSSKSSIVKDRDSSGSNGKVCPAAEEESKECLSPLKKQESAQASKKIKSDVLFEDLEYDVQEYDDCIVIRGQVLKKPFIEKPINAEDHEIMIHYSNDSPCGSGYSVLFRKTESACSQFIPTSHQSTIRTTGSYLYEEFLRTDGFDIKVYTVGEDYAHAEARRCPSIDGKVQRDETTGKEVRYPVNLNAEEKEMARRICREFKQDICGFDMLRCGGNTYVCDVNGFSFVKTSFKYYEDCAMQLRRIIHKKLNLSGLSISKSLDASSAKSDAQMRPFRPQNVVKQQETRRDKEWELRSVVAVFRHGDRTPKQKMKMKIKDPEFLKFFNKGTKDVKLKKPKEMQEILKVTSEKIKRILRQEDSMRGVEDEKVELEKLVQLKYVLERDKFEGLNRKIQMKCLQCVAVPGQFDSKGKPLCTVTEALFILKFGGELTHAGCNQADQFGTEFRRKMYVEDKDEANSKSGGLLRLHSTYRHDLKVYTSDEGRCQKTAASFLKGLLQIEGALAPILAIMVINSKQTKTMLDDSTPAQEALDSCKVKLQKLMHYNDEDMADEFRNMFDENPPDLIDEILHQIKNPFRMLRRVAEMVEQVIQQLEEQLLQTGTSATSLESYRQLPKVFDNIFHKNVRKQKSTLGAQFSVEVGKLGSMSSIGDSAAFMRNRSHSMDDNENSSSTPIARQRDNSVDSSSFKDTASSNVIQQPQSTGLKPLDSQYLQPQMQKSQDKDSNSPDVEKTQTDEESFQAMKKTFLRRMEKGSLQKLSPQHRIMKKNPTTDVIKELQEEEDNVSFHSRKDQNMAAGISVNYKLNGNEAVCDGQPLIIQLKRWKKIAADYSKKDGTFDISKIPEICDNIKFDNLHNPELINKMRLDLLETSQLLCRVIVPMEYGVTTNDKIEIGLKIISPLLKKIEHDILWWKTEPSKQSTRQQKEFGEERQWEKSGLDHNGLDDRVRSSWRHIRTRLYFTSASHMYTLLHTLKLGVDSILIDETDIETKKQLDGILRLDFMSSFVFRLFEDLRVNEGDPSRFKLEIMVNRGAAVDGEIIMNVKNHTVDIKHENFLDINKSLTLEQLETFFEHLLTMQESTLNSPQPVIGLVPTKKDSVKSAKAAEKDSESAAQQEPTGAAASEEVKTTDATEEESKQGDTTISASEKAQEESKV